MKVLILSCDTGEGHNSAAAAVAGALTQRGIESHVFDPLVLAGKYAERFVSGAYTTIMKKAPSAFNALYRAGVTAPGVTLALMVVMVAALLLSMACYVRYYDLTGMAALVDGAVPLACGIVLAAALIVVLA